jgi:hypothetical protein
MKDRKTWVILNILSLAVTLIVNNLAVTLPLNDMTTRDISDIFDIYFVPAGYVFSIWGLIYVGLIAFAIFQALPAQRSDPMLAKIDPWFALSNIINALWLFCFHYLKFLLALIMMIALLLSIITIFVKLEIGKKRMKKVWKWTVETPFSIYLGWVTVATIANVTQVLDYLNWNGFGIAPEVWFVITICVAVIISALMSFTRKAFEFTLVLVWAFIGIAVKFPDVPLVNYASWGGAVAVSVIAMLALTFKPVSKK